MAKRSERVKYLIDNFIKFHNEGMSIPEIAEKSAVTTRTIYSYLQEIADQNGVTRESLLEKVHKPHEVTKFGEHKKTPKIDGEALVNRYSEVIRTAEDLQQELRDLIKKQEEN